MRHSDGRQYASGDSVGCLVCFFGVCDLAGNTMMIETTVTPIADLEELFGLEVQCEVWVLGQNDQYAPCANAAEYQVVQGCCGAESLMCSQCFQEMLSPGIVCEPCDFMSWPKMTRRV